MSLLSEDRTPFCLPPVSPAPEGDESDLFSFRGSVGPDGENRREDVIKAQILLASTGDLDPGSLNAPTGWPGSDLYRAARKFQARQGMVPDGLLLPVPPDGVGRNGEGETLHALRGEVGEDFMGRRAPTPDEVDALYEAERQGIVLSDTLPTRPPQPKPGEEVAFAPALIPAAIAAAPVVAGAATRIAPRLPSLWRSVTGALSAGAALPLGSDNPASVDPPLDHDQVRTPDPAQPEEDKVARDTPLRRGRIVFAPDGTELHVPPLGDWADGLKGPKRDFAESFHDQLSIEMLHHGGSRGGAITQHQLQIVAKVCTDLASEMLPGFDALHVAGARNDKGEKLPEEQMWIYNEFGERLPSGFRRPDFSIRLARSVAIMLRGNSFDAYRDGTPKPREQRARDAIQEMSPNEPMVMIPKFKPDTPDSVVEKEADRACRAALNDLKLQLEEDGEWLKPKPTNAPDYEGPLNKQKADEIKKQFTRQKSSGK